MSLLSWLRRAETSPISRPAAWVYEMLGATRSGAGIVVNRQKALGYSPVWAAVSIISSDVARLPLHTFKRMGNDRQRDRMHPLAKLLDGEANSEMSAYNFRRCMMVQALLHQNAYALWEPDEPALWPIDSEIVEQKRDNRMWQLYYTVHTDKGPVDVEADRIFHLRGLSLNGTSGLSLIQYARESLGLGLATRDYSSRFFQNDARPGLLFTFPEGTKPPTVAKGSDPMADFVRKWNTEHSGVEKAHKAAGVAAPIKVEQIGVAAKDAMLIESMAFSVQDVSRLFTISPWYLASTQATNIYSNRLSMLTEHRDRCLGPWLANWEAEIQRTLLADQPDIFAEFERHDLLSMDPVERTNLLKTQIDAGIITTEEARRILNLGPMPEGAQPQPQPAPQGGPDED